MFRVNVLCLVAFCTCFAREPPIIEIPSQGTIQGKEMSMIRTQRIYAFLGIPYAKPPVDNLRFAPPAADPPPAWEGILNATEYQPPCIQTQNNFKKQELPFFNLLNVNKYGSSEDCLYLNVFVPYGNAPPGGFATIIWFHPGNFSVGNPALWNPYTLVYRQRVIVVTFSWRLNVFGFLTTMDGEAPGNFGLMDQQAAMQWVKTNVNVFEGNPDNICLMGYGSGAISIGIHMVNAQSKGLFAKVIAMSGNFLSAAAFKHPSDDKGVIDEIVDNFGCIRTPTSALMECLRRLEAVALAEHLANFYWRPLIDVGLSNSTPPFVPELPRALFERGEFHKVPMLTGFTNMEDVLSIDALSASDNITNDNLHAILNDIVNRDLPLINGTEACLYNYDHIMDSVMFFYGPNVPLEDSDKIRKLVSDFNTDKYYGAATFLQATYVSKARPTYVYRFDMKPSTSGVLANIPDWVSVPHLFDLIYVWGIPYWVPLPNQEWDIRDKRTSDIIMSFWANFAKTSNPVESSIYPIPWDNFRKTDPGILIIDRTFNMTDQARFNYKSFQFWNDYYPKVIEIATQCCNATDATNALQTFNNYIEIFIASHILFSLPRLL